MGPDVVIPIAKPFFGEEEMRAVQRPLESGWVVQGPYVRKFEEAFAEYTGSRNAVATSSCTTALHVAVAALGLERRGRPKQSLQEYLGKRRAPVSDRDAESDAAE